jgi:ABC-type glutathione transport system ATPase component
MLKVLIQAIRLKEKSESKILLSDLNFELNPGKIFTILGKNGSGKSTLIKSLTNLLDRRFYEITGQVFWNDKDILSLEDSFLLNIRKNEIRYVFQDLTNSFDQLKKFKYYFDNSGFDRQKISELLDYFLLPDYVHLSNLHPYEVSGGMAQRISLALALLPLPALIILDEPTSAIDFTNVNLVTLKLKEMISSGNQSALIVTQDVKFAKEISDEIAFLSNGKLGSFKTTENFFLNPYGKLDVFLRSYKELK